ncbi:MAG: hypothetical protein LIP12_09185 [Clostridiales bacterium]|nr:hypothetical protein [Clostridiales bacterium]
MGFNKNNKSNTATNNQPTGNYATKTSQQKRSNKTAATTTNAERQTCFSKEKGWPEANINNREAKSWQTNTRSKNRFVTLESGFTIATWLPQTTATFP